MYQRAWTHIPPDSEVVLYLACGDGHGAEALRQQYPNIRIIASETEATQREKARQYGFFVAKDAAAALRHIQQNELTLNAWVMERGAWEDETLNRSCRRHLTERMCLGATLVWEVANSQYWQHLLAMIQGKPNEEIRHTLQEIKQEWQQCDVQNLEIVARTSGPDKEFPRFMSLLQPILSALYKISENSNEIFGTDFFVLRGRYKMQESTPLSIATLLGETQVCARVRVDEPHAFLATLPQITCCRFEEIEEAPQKYEGRLVWIWQRRLFSYESMVFLQRSLLECRALTIQEWDDDPLHWEEHFLQSRFVELRSAHALQTSTEPLADYLRQFNPEVKIFPNCISFLPPLRLTTPPVTTLFFGALNRKDDWMPILSPLNRVLNKMGKRIRMIVVFDRDFFEAVQCEQKEFVPLCPYPLYQRLLHQSDVALLPLLPTRFNNMKSDLKFLECAAMSTAVLASSTVYAGSVRQGVTGILYETESQFRDGLEKLIEDIALRHTIVRNAHQWVEKNRMLSMHYRERLKWYESLFARYDELTDAIGTRVPELHRGRQ